jgi:HEAT repeat protein
MMTRLKRVAVYAAGVAIAAGVVAFLLCGKAAVSGATAGERVARVCDLADNQPRGSAEALAAAARDDSDGSVRRAAIIALERFRQAPCARGAIERAISDADPLVRSAAANALRNYRDDAAARWLAEMAGGDSDEAVRAAAVKALGGMETPEAAEILLDLFAKAPPGSLKTAACEAALNLVGRHYPTSAQPWDASRWHALWGRAVADTTPASYVPSRPPRPQGDLP